MASPSSLLSEEQFQCSICLDIFTSPVSTPCGHNFCMGCIGGYWDSSDACQCPLCKKTFPVRPELSINTFIAGMAEQFRKMRVSSEQECPATAGEVLCDSCTGEKLRAVKSCLVCLASYCESHIQPHFQGAAFRRHRLVEPVSSLEDRLCKKHERLLELFCRRDQTCICVLCTETEHRAHKTVPVEREWAEKKPELGKTASEVHQMIQDRLKKVEEIKQSVKLIKSCARREMKDSVQVFAALQRSIERSQAELVALIEEKQRAAERRAEGLISELEREIAELERRSAELEQLSHSEDPIRFLQILPSLSAPSHMKDWSGVPVHTDLCPGLIRRAVCQLGDRVREEVKIHSVKELKKFEKYGADVTLDPGTAGPWLGLSADGKEVWLVDIPQQLPDSPGRFYDDVCVLAKDGFASGRHYWEVIVGEKKDWALGVAKQSVNRKGTIILSSKNGYWTVLLKKGTRFVATTSPVTLLPLSLKPRKVGVYVDYEEGQVSFYNVETRTHIHTFTDDAFTERLYPFFDPCLRVDGKNGAPLVVSPVAHTD
ncbi:E3 ubiquitin-protein ligase TRIM39-like isoform X2 [Lepisosteus oculatus]